MLTQFFRSQLLEKMLEKLAPFEKFLSTGKKEARPGGGYYEKSLKKISRKLYSLDQSCFKQHNACGFVFAQICAGKLNLYLLHKSDRSLPFTSFLVFLTLGSLNKRKQHTRGASDIVKAESIGEDPSAFFLATCLITTVRRYTTSQHNEVNFTNVVGQALELDMANTALVSVEKI